MFFFFVDSVLVLIAKEMVENSKKSCQFSMECMPGTILCLSIQMLTEYLVDINFTFTVNKFQKLVNCLVIYSETCLT